MLCKSTNTEKFEGGKKVSSKSSHGVIPYQLTKDSDLFFPVHVAVRAVRFNKFPRLKYKFYKIYKRIHDINWEVLSELVWNDPMATLQVTLNKHILGKFGLQFLIVGVP